MSLHCDSIHFDFIYSHSDLKKNHHKATKTGCFFCKHQCSNCVSRRDYNGRLWHRERPKGAKSLMCKAFSWDGGATCSKPILIREGEDLGSLPHVPHTCSHTTWLFIAPALLFPKILLVGMLLPCSKVE